MANIRFGIAVGLCGAKPRAGLDSVDASSRRYDIRRSNDKPIELGILAPSGGQTCMQAIRKSLLHSLRLGFDYVGMFSRRIAGAAFGVGDANPPIDRAEAEAIAHTEFLDQLGGIEKDEMARDLTLLWDAFERQFGGLEGFLASHEQQKDDYFARLVQSTERLTMSRHPTALRYAHSAALMLAYLKAFTRPQPSKADVALGRRIARAIEHGRSMGVSEPAAPKTGNRPVKVGS